VKLIAHLHPVSNVKKYWNCSNTKRPILIVTRQSFLQYDDDDDDDDPFIPLKRLFTHPGKGKKYLFPPKNIQMALGPTQPPIQKVWQAVSSKAKWLHCETRQSPQSKADVKNEWSYTSTGPIRLNGLRRDFIFTTGINYWLLGYLKTILYSADCTAPSVREIYEFQLRKIHKDV
jgi:hypothetical protein